MDNINLNNEQGQQPFVFRKATIGQRFGAFLIDHFILSLVFVPFFFILMVVIRMMDNHPEPPIFLFMLLLPLLFVVLGFRDIVKGQSIGKRVIGIGVIDLHDNYAIPPLQGYFYVRFFLFCGQLNFWFLPLVMKIKKSAIGLPTQKYIIYGNMNILFITPTAMYKIRHYARKLHSTHNINRKKRK